MTINYQKSANFPLRYREYLSIMNQLLVAGFFFSVSTAAIAQDTISTPPYPTSNPVTAPTPTLSDKQINYPNRILREELDFELTPVSEGKFKLNITTQTKGFFFVKVYDVIGNLLYEQKVRVRGNFQQEFDLSEHTTNFFIIEAGNEEFNKTKSIVAT